MYSLQLTCTPQEVDLLSAELWEAGTIGIREIEDGHETVRLIAGFASNDLREHLLARFAGRTPEWRVEDSVDWVEGTKIAWQSRAVGRRIFLAPYWNTDPTPGGRVRVVHNPSLACGTGEHPCTRLALEALEESVHPGCGVVDVGTGSGLLAIAGLKLGGSSAIALDIDVAALQAARENFELNSVRANLVAGSVDCLAAEWSDVTVANISASVLLSILDDLLMVTRAGGWLILTGFAESELAAMRQNVPEGRVSAMAEWRCLTIKMS